MPAADISVVVPCWGADAVPPGVVSRWLASGRVLEVIVAVAPGSAGDASTTAPPEGLRVHRCSRAGRGHQMNEGAALARGDILLFHHADTELEDAIE